MAARQVLSEVRHLGPLAGQSQLRQLANHVVYAFHGGQTLDVEGEDLARAGRAQHQRRQQVSAGAELQGAARTTEPPVVRDVARMHVEITFRQVQEVPAGNVALECAMRPSSAGCDAQQLECEALDSPVHPRYLTVTMARLDPRRIRTYVGQAGTGTRMGQEADIPLAALADELRAKARLIELPFDYDDDTWILAKDSMRLLIALIRSVRPRRVIEFGSGMSTRVIAGELDEGAVVRSFDHVAGYAEKTRASLRTAARRGDFQVLHRPIRLRLFQGKLLPFYGLERGDLAAVGPSDLVVVDGPPHTWGREAALYAAFPAMRRQSILLLDDAQRRGEQRAVQAWRSQYGDAVQFELMPDIGKGILIARKTHALAAGRPFALKERLDAMHGTLRAVWRHRPPLMGGREFRV
jgi:predicted O-methyltransferase YrrM